MSADRFRTIRLGPGGEFDRIRSFIERGDDIPESVRVGPGDDAAVLEGGWILTTDLSIEGVHFRRDWLSPAEIGFRAVTAALSDLAAMAAQPVGLLVSLAMPEGDGTGEALHDGILEAARAVGAVVLGGDLTASLGPLVVDVAAVGRTPWPVLRDGAEPGDDVWVTGRLGGSAAAVDAWLAGREPGPAARAAYARPTARIEEALCLVEREVVDAMIDLSDGLAGDAAHIAAASGVKIVLDEASIPVAEAALDELGPERALRAALHGGEDYELCFVTDPDVVDVVGFERQFGLPLTRVGTVEAGEGVWIRSDAGAVTPVAAGGFDHFRGDR